MPRVDRESYNDYMREYMLRRYEQRRALFIEQLGGCCVDCGSTLDLEFDHADRASKAFEITKRLASAPMHEVRREMAKCVLRCLRCHQVKTFDRDLPNKSLHAPHLLAHQQRIFGPPGVTAGVTNESVGRSRKHGQRCATRRNEA